MEEKPKTNAPASSPNPNRSSRISLRAGQGTIHKEDLPEAAKTALQSFLFMESLFPYEITAVEKKEDAGHPEEPIVYTITGQSVGKPFKLELLFKDGKVTRTRMVS